MTEQSTGYYNAREVPQALRDVERTIVGVSAAWHERATPPGQPSIDTYFVDWQRRRLLFEAASQMQGGDADLADALALALAASADAKLAGPERSSATPRSGVG